MISSARRRLRRLRRVLAYGLLGLLILAALVVAIANQLLPLLARHPDDVAQWLSQRIGRPVTLDAVEARWSRRGPLLSVRGLRVGQGSDVLDAGDAELQINVYAGFLPGVALTDLRMRGVQLQLSRDAQGQWRLEGLGGGARGEAFDLRQLDGLGELQIEAAQLGFVDETSGRRWQLRRIDARLSSVGARFRVGVLARIDDATPLQFVAEFDQDLRDGRIFLGGEQVSLAPWLGGTPLAGIEVVEAHGDFGVWLDVRDRQLQSAQVDATLQPLALRGSEPIELQRDPSHRVEARYGLERARIALQWRREADGWRAQLDELDLDAGDARTTLADMQIEHRDALRFDASGVELGPLASLAMLGDTLSPSLRRWLYEAAPRGRVASLQLEWIDATSFRAQGELAGIGWQPVQRTPGVQGIGGQFDADATAVTLALRAEPLRLDAPGMLRAPLTPQVHGTINAFALQPGWRFEAAGLQVRGDDYAFALDGGIEVQADGSRPLLDLRVDVEPGPIVAAKHFWIIGKMPPKAVAWLDTALVDGRLGGGRALVRGDADFWPFRAHQGRFEAEAMLVDTTLRFRRDWPAGDNVAGTARFINDAIEVDLSGVLAGNRITRVHGGIATLREPVLELDAAGRGRGRDLLALLRASPLQRKFAPYLTGLDVGGAGEVALALHIPLKEELGEPRVEGHVDLQRADLRDTKWNLAFDDATGRVRFSDRGFSADELSVGFGGQLSALSIGVGDYTSDESRIAEASLRGRFAADALLEPHAGLQWLRPWFAGESDWTLQLGVPRDAGDSDEAVQTLRVRSDLVGTRLDLPAPLRKDAADRLGLDLQVQLPLQRGDIDLHLGQLLRLRGRMPDDGGFRGVAMFGDAPDEAMPAQGIVAVGQVPVLDAAGWAAFALSSSGSGAGLQRVDVHAGELDVLDRAFAETRVSFAREADGALALGFRGDVLQGSLQIPTQELATRGITARFERLHWPAAAPRATSALSSSANPAAVPPLHLYVQDFRFGEAALGETRLETYPTPEGMHVQQLDTTSKQLALRASGDWTRIDARERSSFRIAFSAADLGDMLKALGFSAMIDGGQTEAELQATWPGPPSAFELQRLDGTLSAKVGKGRVLEVEPGAGRIFGLLSLTEIPRRLALDFSDFFKSGLAFNQITGSFSLDGGNAFTEDLRIDGPAAEIRVRGRTGLKARDYDQTMEVLPRAGSMLPAIGAIAAGPAGAAIGAVAQAVLQQPIKQMARTLYRVQGSWDEPKIDVIDRGPANANGGARPGR